LKFCIEIAGISIEIHSLFSKIKSISKDYITDTLTPDIVLNIAAKDVVSESETKLSVYQMPDLETLAVYRKIAEETLKYDTFLMHGSVISINGKAYMFTAPSGTGKTTHIRKWLENLPDAFVVNGDKPLIKAGEVPLACGTPWAGKENMQTNTMVPLAAIVLMERAEDNEIRQITFSEAFSGLFRQTYQPKDTEKLKATLRLLKSLDHKVKFYSFKFNNLKDDAFSVSYHALVENN